MSYIGCLRNYDSENNFKISVWSKDKSIENYKFYDEENNQYEIISTFLSDSKLSGHFYLKLLKFDEQNITIKVFINEQYQFTCQGNKNINKIYSVSCDFPHKDSISMWEKVSTDKFTLTMHLGDQVYADVGGVVYMTQVKNRENFTLEERYCEVEKLTIDNFYSGCANNFLNGWHEFLWDDHEVDNGFRSTQDWFDKNYESTNHTLACIKAYSHCQLGKNDSHSSALYEYQNINVLIVDQRSYMTLENIKNGKRWFPEEHEILIKNLLDKIENDNKRLIVCISGAVHSTTPNINFKIFLEKVILNEKSEVDQGASSENSVCYSRLIEILDKYNFKYAPIILGGDIHMAVIKDIISSKRIYKHLISSGVRTTTKSYEPFLSQILYFWERNFEIDDRLNKNIKMKNIHQSELKNIGLIHFYENFNYKISFIDEKKEYSISGK